MIAEPPAGPLQRAIAAVAGTLLALAGSYTLVNGLRVLAAVATATDLSVLSQRDMLYVAVWTVFAASLMVAGVSLLHAAWRARRHDMVPGPTLYVAGASLLVIALFVVVSGALLPGALAATAGVALMTLEYRSERV